MSKSFFETNFLRIMTSVFAIGSGMAFVAGYTRSTPMCVVGIVVLIGHGYVAYRGDLRGMGTSRRLITDSNYAFATMFLAGLAGIGADFFINHVLSA